MEYKFIKTAQKKFHACNSFDANPSDTISFSTDTLWHTNICYGTTYPNSYLDIYQSTVMPGITKPVFFFIHGGGFVWGDKKEDAPNDKECLGPLFARLNGSGIHVITMNYAFAPEYPYPTPLIQISQAMQYLHGQSEKWELDMGHIVIGGASAGGQLAGQFINIQQNAKYAKKCHIAQTIPGDSIVAAVFLSALLDVEQFGNVDSIPGNIVFHKCGQAYFHLKNLKGNKKVQEANVISHAGKQFPPSFLCDANTSSFYKQAERFHQRLDALGIENDFWFYPRETAKLSHGYEMGNSSCAEEIRHALFQFLQNKLQPRSLSAEEKDYPSIIHGGMTYGQVFRLPAFRGYAACLMGTSGFMVHAVKFMKLSMIMAKGSFPQIENEIHAANYAYSIARKQPFFYPIWSKEEKKLDRSKQNTGLMAFPILTGEPKEFIVICPGGAYMLCTAISTEGFPYAQRINEAGMAAFVLYYRTGSSAKAPNPMDDLAAAIRTIQRNAKEFNIKPDRYSLIGSSAGGHLASCFGTKKIGYARYHLPAPKAMILAYPVITMGKFTHITSRKKLLGKNERDLMLQKEYSVEKQIDSDYPPTYLWFAEDDTEVDVHNSLALKRQLDKAGVPNILKKVSMGGHGIGLGSGSDAEGWMDEALRFTAKF